MRLFTVLIFFCLLFHSCTNSSKPFPETNSKPAVSATIDPDVLENTSLFTSASVKAFYRMNEWRMVWADSFALRPDADSLIRFIHAARSLGLNPQDYHDSKLSSATTALYTQQYAQETDVLLTDAFFTLWYQLKNGRVDRKTFSRVKIDSVKLTDAMAALKDALASHSVVTVLKDREPKLSTYASLKIALLKTLKDLNDSVRLKQYHLLVANLERLRWEEPLPSRFISVNVPSFMLRVIDGDSLILESRVIIGKPETPTPNIKSVVQSFIIYPYWHVPKSILDEILPAVQADTNYLRKHNYQVIDSKGRVVRNATVDFKRYTAENFPYILRQREGSENTMGVIKFVFPNNYGVYLHDTNARKLFAKSDRALSHGCIRVQKAVELAKYLAKDDDTYVDAADLEQYLIVRKRLEVKIVKPIPVYLNYFTVEIKDDSVIFYRDLYQKDRALLDSLNH